MTTVARRTFRSNPQRDALQTWTAIVDLLTQGKTGAARIELLAVGGVAASVITEQAPRTLRSSSPATAPVRAFIASMTTTPSKGRTPMKMPWASIR